MIFYDSVGGDILLNIKDGYIDTSEYKNRSDELLHMVTGRLKDYYELGNVSKYSLYKYIGNGITDTEDLVSSSIISMMTFDGLISRDNIKVAAIRDGNNIKVGILILDENTGRSIIDLSLMIDGDGEIIWQYK